MSSRPEFQVDLFRFDRYRLYVDIVQAKTRVEYVSRGV